MGAQGVRLSLLFEYGCVVASPGGSPGPGDGGLGWLVYWDPNRYRDMLKEALDRTSLLSLWMDQKLVTEGMYGERKGQEILG